MRAELSQEPVLTKTVRHTVFPWVVVSCGMLFYCFNYFLRLAPSVMQDHLIQVFHINATQLGTLVGLYYWGYTPMQIPAGMLYDRFGARFVLCIASLIAAVGLSLFIATNDYTIAGYGRFFMGIGCAFAYIGTLKLASIWLPTNRFGTVAGLATAIGMLSGAISQTYLNHLIAIMGYREVLHIAAIIGVLLSAVLWLIVRNKPKIAVATTLPQINPINLSQLMGALRILLRNKQMWLIGAIGCALYLPASVFLDLWGIPYLKAVYHITQEQAVAISSCVFLGWIISCPIVGIISDKWIKRRVMPIIVSGLLVTILLCIIFYVPGISIPMLYPIFFLMGCSCGAHPLCFALGKENNPIQMSGTTVAATNMFVMTGGAIFQPVVGKLLDLHTLTPNGPDGLPIYTASDYTFALSVIPIGVAIGIILSFFLKETHCQSQAKMEDEALFVPTLLQPKTEAI